MAEETRTLICKFTDGSVKRVTFPANWTVTFSTFIPKMNERGFTHGQPSLRIYGPRKVQMGCLVGVDSFRDEQIEIESLNKSELEDLYWVPQMELDLAPVIEKGEVKRRRNKIPKSPATVAAAMDETRKLLNMEPDSEDIPF